MKKLRLAGINTYQAANTYLKERYFQDHNRRYARPAASESDYHRRRPTARQLDDVFCLEEERVVSQDWVVRYNNQLLQLERQSQHWAPAKSHALVRENKAGKIAIHYRGRRLSFHQLLPVSKSRSEERGAAPSPAPPSPQPRRHPPVPQSHPWRRDYRTMRTPGFYRAG